MWNISYFKTFPQRQRLMGVNGLVSDKIYFEADTGQDREPVEFLAKVFTAGLLKRTGDYACKSVLNSLQPKNVFFMYTNHSQMLYYLSL